MSTFDEVEHTADWAFRVRGRDLRELFQNAAQAMCQLQGQAGGEAAGQAREVEVHGYDRETLLVNWLNELLYLQEAHGESYSGFRIEEISEVRLRATLRAQPHKEGRRLIKAVTFHGLKVERSARGWEATVVVDV